MIYLFRGLLAILILFLLSLSHSHSVFSHAALEQIIGNYHVSVDQTPLSPFVGEEVTVTFTVYDETDNPVRDLKGTVIIKEEALKEFVGSDAEHETKQLHYLPITTDMNGVVSVDYTFKKEGTYDVEFQWGQEESQSAGRLIQVREPTSFFLAEELQKRIWLFVAIAFGGIIIGAIGTFILMTTTLNPKR